jgi:hypothetical protein
MRTFEQLYKSVLLTKLRELLSEYRLTVSNDINNTDIIDDKDIICIINTGQGIRSSLPGYDATQVPIFLAFKVATNNLQTILSKLVGFVNDVNGINSSIMTTDDLGNEFSYTYKITYNNPSPFGTPYDISTDTKKYKFSNVYLNGTCLYSSVAPIEVLKGYLRFDADFLEIDNLLSYGWNYTAHINSTFYEGQITAGKKVSDIGLIFTFVLAVNSQSALQARLYTFIKNLETSDVVFREQTFDGSGNITNNDLTGKITSIAQTNDGGFPMITIALMV